MYLRSIILLMIIQKIWEFIKLKMNLEERIYQSTFHFSLIYRHYFKVSDINSNFELCPTYPEFLILPRSTNPETLRECASFRRKNRFPAVTWCHPVNQATLSRCSQPRTGIRGHSNTSDEIVVAALSKHTDNGKLHIIDCRSKIAALANCARGGGHENIDNYHNATMSFQDIENIHTMRKSFSMYSELATRKELPNRTQFDQTNWLEHIAQVIRGGIEVATLLDKGVSVLVHCSDGWDRTAQVMSLGQLLIDPYYRTIEGFGILIQKEWISFGHKFQDRVGHGQPENYNNECSPIFIQFIEIVYHLTQVFEKSFEFNEIYLITLLDNLYSNQYGDFLGNCEKDRRELNISVYTKSLWPYFLNPKKKYRFKNLEYDPEVSPNRLELNSFTTIFTNLWISYYARYNCELRAIYKEKNNKSDFRAYIEQIAPQIIEAISTTEIDGKEEYELFIENNDGDLFQVVIKNNKIKSAKLSKSKKMRTLEDIIMEDYDPSKKRYCFSSDRILEEKIILVEESSSDTQSPQKAPPQSFFSSIMGYFHTNNN
eukprot:TRINITY_DN2573_c0_g2_i4.p1 TRINITY_DN2573_c0_g2~~TRINITY_DN2573_c0_g2_i4.p1  ORF type:complete len:542 (-),score=81.81 TRINITY_DN2573_c0_g2_i4:1270-2895(-)